MGTTHTREEEGENTPFAQTLLPIARFHLRKIDNAFPRFTAPAAEIGIFKEKEETVVEPSQRGKKFPPDQEAPAGNPVCIPLPLRILAEL